MDWIKCSDQLPRPDQEVLIFLDEREEMMHALGYSSLITIATYLGDMGEFESDWDADANAPIEDGCQPSHWMPLPAPPAA